MLWQGSKQDPAKPHPSRPLGRKTTDTAKRQQALARGRARAAERRRRIEAGEIT